MTNLTKHDIALIGIKLLAIYFFILTLNQLSYFSFSLFKFGKVPTGIFSLGITFFYLFIMLAIPILLWLYSKKIARFMIETYSAPLTIDKKANELQDILICVVGILIFVLTMSDFLPLLFSTIYTYIKGPVVFSQWLWNSHLPTMIIALLLKTILSLVLIFKAKNISSWLNHLRYAGTK